MTVGGPLPLNRLCRPALYAVPFRTLPHWQDSCKPRNFAAHLSELLQRSHASPFPTFQNRDQLSSVLGRQAQDQCISERHPDAYPRYLPGTFTLLEGHLEAQGRCGGQHPWPRWCSVCAGPPIITTAHQVLTFMPF